MTSRLSLRANSRHLTRLCIHGADRLRGFVALVSCLAGASCGTARPPVVDFTASPPVYRSEDYADVYRRWTRHEKVTYDLESALEMWATFKSPDYREAFVAKYADVYHLTEGARSTIAKSQHEAGTTQYEFVVTAQSANYRWNDLEKKSSPWRVSLRDGYGRRLSPEKIVVERFPEMYELEFFPRKTPFTKTYTFRFTRSSPEAATAASGGEDSFSGERSGQIILSIAGPLGSTEMIWSSRP